jgi:hypothetical protein
MVVDLMIVEMLLFGDYRAESNPVPLGRTSTFDRSSSDSVPVNRYVDFFATIAIVI